jgi:hypothetical protein
MPDVAKGTRALLTMKPWAATEERNASSRYRAVLSFLPLLMLIGTQAVPHPLTSVHGRVPAHSRDVLQLSQSFNERVEEMTPGDEVDFVDPDTGAREYGTLQTVDDDAKKLEVRDDATNETHEVDLDDVLEVDDF